MDRRAIETAVRIAIPALGWLLLATAWHVSSTTVCDTGVAVSGDDDLAYGLIGGAIALAIAGVFMNVAPAMRRDDWLWFGGLAILAAVAVLSLGVAGAMIGLLAVVVVGVLRGRRDRPRAKLNVAAAVAALLIVPAGLVAASVAALRCSSMF